MNLIKFITLFVILFFTSSISFAGTDIKLTEEVKKITDQLSLDERPIIFR